MLKGFKILQWNDIQPELEHLHAYGWDNGLYVGFPQFKNHYNMMVGGVTDWTGHPGHGKTEMCLEMLFNMSSFFGWVHMLYVPDIGKSIEVMAKLIHKYTGKTFIKRYQNYIGLTEAFNSCTWLMEHFKILHKTDTKANLSPVELWDYAVEYKQENRLDSVMIDSWKDMRHDYKDYGGGYATYLSHVLPVRNEIAEKHRIHMHTVIHPKNPDSRDLKLRPVNTRDMEGGAQWANSGKCIISIFREDFDSDVTDVYFRKIKPESVGRTTSTPVSLKWDYVSSRYYYEENGNKIYANKNYSDPKEIRQLYAI